jgi:uncharacterized membrane protein
MRCMPVWQFPPFPLPLFSLLPKKYQLQNIFNFFLFLFKQKIHYNTIFFFFTFLYKFFQLYITLITFYYKKKKQKKKSNEAGLKIMLEHLFVNSNNKVAFKCSSKLVYISIML